MEAPGPPTSSGRHPLDGKADCDRVRIVTVGEGKPIAVISVEDLIADRVAQWASGTAADRIEQARALLGLHPDVDRAYLQRRIRNETGGDHGIEAPEG